MCTKKSSAFHNGLLENVCIKNNVKPPSAFTRAWDRPLAALQVLLSRWCFAPLALLVRVHQLGSLRLLTTYALRLALLPGFRLPVVRTAFALSPIPCGLPVPFYLCRPGVCVRPPSSVVAFPFVCSGGGTRTRAQDFRKQLLITVPFAPVFGYHRFLLLVGES